jgi:hypothetical protein
MVVHPRDAVTEPDATDRPREGATTPAGDGAAAPEPAGTEPDGTDPAAPVDPVTERRARIARWVLLGKRIGYSALALAIGVFSVALYWDLPRVLIGIIVACLVVACVTLAPSIVFGYGVMAADREDRELGRTPPGPGPGRRRTTH